MASILVQPRNYLASRQQLISAAVWYARSFCCRCWYMMSNLSFNRREVPRIHRQSTLALTRHPIAVRKTAMPQLTTRRISLIEVCWMLHHCWQRDWIPGVSCQLPQSKLRERCRTSIITKMPCSQSEKQPIHSRRKTVSWTEPLSKPINDSFLIMLTLRRPSWRNWAARSSSRALKAMKTTAERWAPDQFSTVYIDQVKTAPFAPQVVS